MLWLSDKLLVMMHVDLSNAVRSSVSDLLLPAVMESYR